MSHFGPDEAIARIDAWKGRDVRYEELGGGITNHNYIVYVDGGPPKGEKYVLRVPGRAPTCSSTVTWSVTAWCRPTRPASDPASPTRSTPKAPSSSTSSRARSCIPTPSPGTPSASSRSWRPSRSSTTKAVFKNQIRVFDMLRKYTKLARDINAPMPPELESLLVEMDTIEKATAVRPVKDVACHNDLLSENFIIDATGKMWVIDWEYGGMTDPFFDLGDFVMEHPFSRDEERLIAATYCGEMDEGRFGRMMLYKIVSGVWWGVWAMIQKTVSHIDFDYMEWGMDRVVNRSQAGVDDPDYKIWLANA